MIRTYNIVAFLIGDPRQLGASPRCPLYK